MKIRMGNLEITGSYSEVKSIFTALSLQDMEIFENVEKKVREAKLDINDIESKILTLTKIVERLDEEVISKIVEAMQ